MKSDAELSKCRTYRYALWRTWDESKPFAMFVGLNPSTADELEDDPTIRRCINFSKLWGYGGLCMVNLFAYRATDPTALFLVAVDDAPKDYTEGLMRGIVGVEIKIEKLTGKLKSSQNQPECNQLGVKVGLKGEIAVNASAMSQFIS